MCTTVPSLKSLASDIFKSSERRQRRSQICQEHMSIEFKVEPNNLFFNPKITSLPDKVRIKATLQTKVLAEVG